MNTQTNSYPWQTHYPNGIKWDVIIGAKPVYEMLDQTAEKYPDRPAIDFLGTQISFKELKIQVDRFAGALQEMGVTKNTKIALLLPNCPQFIISYYGILKAGACVVNCNPLYTLHELENQLNDAQAEIIITLNLKKIFEKASSLESNTTVKKIIISDFASQLPCATRFAFRIFKSSEIAKPAKNDERIICFESLLKTKHTLQPVTINPMTDVAVLQYTGGTTGIPKGAMLTHANIYANAVQTGMWFHGLEEGQERIVGILPLFHVFAMTVVMNLAIHKACEMILYPRLDLKHLLKDMAKKKPTVMPGVPTLFSSICHYPTIKKYRLSSIKMCISGGAPLVKEVKKSFEVLTGCVLIEGYGLTETSPVVSANPLFGKQKEGSIGLPFPATIVEIRDPETHKIMPVGERGEICISGPQVMKGYFNNEEQTNDILKEGWVHTGDIGYMDEEGYVYIVDRIKDMIITSGFNVYPREVEEEIIKHPSVKEVAVKGIKNERHGELIKAFIVFKQGKSVSKQEIIEFLKPHLAKYKLPAQVEFRDDLPKTMIGKIDKKVL